MKDKEKLIEKMAKETGCCDYPQRDCEKCWCKEKRECSAYAYAETYYEKDYRKIDKDSVVFSREEYQKDFSNQFNKGYKHGSKETAEKILNELYHREELGFETIKWYAKEYWGIDIKE